MSHMMQPSGGASTPQQYGQGGGSYDAGQQSIRPLGSLAPGAPIGPPQTLDIRLVSFSYLNYTNILHLVDKLNWVPEVNRFNNN
jgi:hypothetical protein